MTISWEEKLREARRIASLDLPGRALDVAIVLLCHLNPNHGIAFPSTDKIAADLDTSTFTVGRATGTLEGAGVIKWALRREAAVRWFPGLMDMSQEEAKHR